MVGEQVSHHIYVLGFCTQFYFKLILTRLNVCVRLRDSEVANVDEGASSADGGAAHFVAPHY